MNIMPVEEIPKKIELKEKEEKKEEQKKEEKIETKETKNDSIRKRSSSK